MSKAAGRALDAILNRLSEALRTVEDALRFEASETVELAELKRLRRSVQELRTSLDKRVGPLYRFRQTESDPGNPRRHERGKESPTRSSALDLCGANLARARESSRSLEEQLRRFDPQLAAVAEQLRYDLYSFEQRTLSWLDRGRRLERVRLYVLVTSSLAAGPILDVARATLDGGAQLIQLREKTLPKRQFLELAQSLRALTDEYSVPLIVNDQIDIAELAGADGVHQGQEDLTPNQVRQILGPRGLVGISTHSVEQARQAESDGADYIGVGPIFETPTKEHRRAVGLDYIRAASQAARLPGFAIGQVNRETLEAVIAAGARRVAVCTGIIAARDVEKTTRWFRTRIDQVDES